MGKFTNSNSTLEAARRWMERGYFVIPVPLGKKAPIIDNWPALRLTAKDLPRFFSEPCNIGILQGAPYGAADVDLDCLEVLAGWSEFALETALIFGRQSAPRSHYFYFADPPVKSVRYVDPIDKSTLMEVRCLKSDGEVGLQTIVPPSLHESGEAIRFDVDGEAANIDNDVLQRAAAHTAGAVLLAKHFPAEGSRNTAFLALAGVLARALWKLADAIQLHRAIYRCLWPADPDLCAAESEVKSTFKRLEDGRDVTGFPTLSQLIDAKALKAAMRWLNVVVEEPTSIQVDSEALEPDTDLRILNAAAIFGRRIQITGVRQRGPMYIGSTTAGAEIFWDSIKDVMSFHASQNAIAAATNVVIPSPPRNKITAVWEPIAERILRLASKDNVVTEPGLVEEFRNLIPAVWTRASRPGADFPEELVEILRNCASYRRDSQGEPPDCAVWRYGNSCFLHLPTLLRFLSTASANNKHFPAPDAQKALLLLGFRYVKDLHRSFHGITAKASVWVGPIDILREDPADPADGEVT